MAPTTKLWTLLTWVAALVAASGGPGVCGSPPPANLSDPGDGIPFAPSPGEASGSAPPGSAQLPASFDESEGRRLAPPAAAGLDLAGPPAAGCAATEETGLLDNLSLFAGLDGSKQPQDLGINANFGFRTAVNWGYPLLEDYGLGVQLGTAVNYSRTAVAVLETVTGTHDRTQSFTTAGLFQRTDWGLSWGLAFDYLAEHYYQGIDLGQGRGQVGYALGGDDELGLWGTVGAWTEGGAVGDKAFQLKPITQGNLYWRHIWPNEAVTRMWIGVAEEHGRFVYLLPDRPPIHDPVVFGADIYLPLTDRLALFGEANFITPNDTGTVDATLGFVIALGGPVCSPGRRRFAPLLPVANNSSFAVDLER